MLQFVTTSILHRSTLSKKDFCKIKDSHTRKDRLMNFLTSLKLLLKNSFKSYSTADKIENECDFEKVKKWTSKVLKLYVAFTVIAALEMMLIPILAHIVILPAALAYVLFPFMFLLTNWGYATLILYIPTIFKTLVNAGRVGYEVGKHSEHTHIEINHEFGNDYTVREYKTNDGCLVAYIAIIARFLVWAFFCVYIGPFLTFKKYKSSIDSLKKYESKKNTSEA